MSWKYRDFFLFSCLALFCLLMWFLAPGFIDRDIIHLHADNIANGEVNLWYSYSYSKIALFFWRLTKGIYGIYYFQTLLFGLSSFFIIYFLYKKHQRFYVSLFSMVYLFFLPSIVGIVFLPVRDVLFVNLTVLVSLYPIFLATDIKNKRGSYIFFLFLCIAILTMDLKQQSAAFFMCYFVVLIFFPFLSRSRLAILALCAVAFGLIRYSAGYPWIPPEPIYSAPGKVVFLNYLTKHGVVFSDENRKNLEPFYELNRFSTITLDVGHPPFSLGGIKTEDPVIYDNFSREVTKLMMDHPDHYLAFRFKVITMLNGWQTPFAYFWDWPSLKEDSRDRKLAIAKIDVQQFHPYREKIRDFIFKLLSPSVLSPIIFSTLLPFILMAILYVKSFKGSKLRFFILTQCLYAPLIWFSAPMPMFRYSFPAFVASILAIHIYYYEKTIQVQNGQNKTTT